MLVFVSSVSEGSYCIHVEGVLSHADNIRSCLGELNMSFLVYSLGVSFYFSFYCLFELLWLALKFCANLLSNLQVLALIEREE